MNTEKHIIYQLINIVNNHVHNNDQPITERLMRGYLKTYRGDSLRKYYKDGVTIGDEVMQVVPMEFTKTASGDLTSKFPKIMRLSDGAGFRLMKEGISIPIVDSEQYQLSKRNTFGSANVQARTFGSDLELYIPDLSLKNAISGVTSNVIRSIESELKFNGKAKVYLQAVLVNPDDCPTYDWEVDPYPFPNEKDVELMSQILRGVFGISVQMKKDEVQNSRADNIIYQDEFKVDGGV